MLFTKFSYCENVQLLWKNLQCPIKSDKNFVLFSNFGATGIFSISESSLGKLSKWMLLTSDGFCADFPPSRPLQYWQNSRTARWRRRRTTRGCRSCSSSCSTTCPATWRQGCGSAFISSGSGSGSGSSMLGWIPVRIQYGSRALMTKNWQKITAEKKN